MTPFLIAVGFGVGFACGAWAYNYHARRLAVLFGWRWCLLRAREVEVLAHKRETGEWTDAAPKRDKDGNRMKEAGQ